MCLYLSDVNSLLRSKYLIFQNTYTHLLSILSRLVLFRFITDHPHIVRSGISSSYSVLNLLLDFCLDFKMSPSNQSSWTLPVRASSSVKTPTSKNTFQLPGGADWRSEMAPNGNGPAVPADAAFEPTSKPVAEIKFEMVAHRGGTLSRREFNLVQ